MHPFSRSLLTIVLVALLPQVLLSQRGIFPRPGADNGPTPVKVGIYVNDVLKVNGAEQLLTVDFFMVQRWRDPSLAGNSARTVASTDIWTPHASIVNEGRLFPKLPNRVEVDADGNARITQRYVGTLTNRLPLFDFPFDRQVFRIQVAVPKTATEVSLTGVQELSGQRAEFTLTDWEVSQGALVASPYEFAPGKLTYAGLAYEIPAVRRLAFYLWKGIVPLSLVVLMAFVVFWIDSAQLGPRLSVAVTSMLTLIAYRFLLGSLLPRLSYLTRMDWYTLGCTMLVFFTLVGVVEGGHLRQTGREVAAERLDRAARVLFPTAFLAVVVGSYFG